MGKRLSPFLVRSRRCNQLDGQRFLRNVQFFPTASWSTVRRTDGEGWMVTTISFMPQCLLVTMMVIVPLWFTDVLPKQQLLTFLNGGYSEASAG